MTTRRSFLASLGALLGVAPAVAAGIKPGEAPPFHTGGLVPRDAGPILVHMDHAISHEAAEELKRAVEEYRADERAGRSKVMVLESRGQFRRIR